jgi:uncharacterized protein YegP (UPF0339 family)
MAGLFEVYQDRANKWRFRLRTSTNYVVATGPAFETERNAVKGCEMVQDAADGAKIVFIDKDGREVPA